MLGGGSSRPPSQAATAPRRRSPRQPCTRIFHLRVTNHTQKQSYFSLLCNTANFRSIGNTVLKLCLLKYDHPPPLQTYSQMICHTEMTSASAASLSHIPSHLWSIEHTYLTQRHTLRCVWMKQTTSGSLSATCSCSRGGQSSLSGQDQ